ncbi:unnamed protein product [Moneuplotes crassus]|uniref:Uncharacterized protein n=1 Tax=Euplotes crassus TaxID=5936 RepID=A0AAD1UG94_EUPCR|nr:unnamed protein product [Moneuplotes crassus]
MEKLLKARSKPKPASSKALSHFKKFKITRDFIKKLKKRRDKTKKDEKRNHNILPDSEHHIKRMINEAMIAINIPHAQEMIGRKEIIQIASVMGVDISRLQATEIILRARGPRLEENRSCNLDEIVSWFKENLKLLRPKKKIIHKSIHLESSRADTLADSRQKFSVYSSNSQRRRRENFSTEPRIHRRINSFFDTKSTMPNKLRKMGINNIHKNQNFKKISNEHLLNITEVPSQKKKTNSFLSSIEEKMLKTQIQQSEAAARRSRIYLSETRRKNIKEYKNKLKNMINETARTSANSALRLSKLLARPYFEKVRVFSLNSSLNSNTNFRIKSKNSGVRGSNAPC